MCLRQGRIKENEKTEIERQGNNLRQLEINDLPSSCPVTADSDSCERSEGLTCCADILVLLELKILLQIIILLLHRKDGNKDDCTLEQWHSSQD